MQVLLAKEMGFCLGVKQAVELATKTAAQSDGVWILGSLVHNPQVVARLQEQGIGLAGGLSDVPQGTVVIPSHGLPPGVIEQAKARGLRVVDATCPMVRAIQRRACKLAEAGFLVVVFGDPHHSEMKGIVGWAQGRALVVSRLEELEALPSAKRVALLAQSTQSLPAFEEMATRLVQGHLKRALEIRIYHTICEATAKRQEAALVLAGQVEAVLVVGGKDSANTRRLAQLCMGVGVPTYQVEEAGEVQSAWLAGCQRVGLTAGASTPDWVIAEVLERLQRE